MNCDRTANPQGVVACLERSVEADPANVADENGPGAARGIVDGACQTDRVVASGKVVTLQPAVELRVAEVRAGPVGFDHIIATGRAGAGDIEASNTVIGRGPKMG